MIEAGLFQGRPKVSVELHQGTRDAVADRTGLAGRAAAVDIYKNVEFLGRFRQAEAAGE